MSASIAVIALAGAASLPLTSSISNPLLATVPVGMWAKASISPLSELAREAGSAAGWQRRSCASPQFVNLSPRAIAEVLVRAFVVVEIEPGANARLGLGHRRISVEIELLVFQAAPQPLDEDAVHAALAYRLPWSVLKFSGRL